MGLVGSEVARFSLFFNGDSGYGKHFAETGERFGPFDVVLMENGAYNSSWAQIHMQPEQSVQAALDVRARMVLPIHWAKYDLALHEWREPIERFMAAAKNKPLQVAPRTSAKFLIIARRRNGIGGKRQNSGMNILKSGTISAGCGWLFAYNDGHPHFAKETRLWKA